MARDGRLRPMALPEFRIKVHLDMSGVTVLRDGRILYCSAQNENIGRIVHLCLA